MIYPFVVDYIYNIYIDRYLNTNYILTVMKTLICITLDVETYQILKEQTTNISGTINELLKTALFNQKPEIKETFDIAKNIVMQRKELADLERLKRLAMEGAEKWKMKAEEHKQQAKITHILG